MATAWRQKYTPKLSVTAIRGWCLKYIDDAGGVKNTLPPRSRSAQIAYQAEARAKRIRANQKFPVGVWVVGYWALNSGQYKGLGHVAFIKNFGNRVEIRDSEVRAGARSPYTSVSQVNAWFGNHSPRFLGWSTHTSGRQYAESYKVQKGTGKRIARRGTARVTASALNVRNSPSTTATIAAVYSKGQTFNYDSYVDAGGYRWLSYISWSGRRRYVAQGKGKTKYVTGGV